MNPEQFQSLDEKKKKEFLSNDMAERIMRVEQRVSARFGKLIPYFNTEYYKSLTPIQKKSFEKYVRNKGKKKVLVSLVFLIPVLLIFLLNIKFTGNVVNESFGNYNLLDYLLIVILILSFLIFIAYLAGKKSREKKINSHINIVDNILMKKSRLK